MLFERLGLDENARYAERYTRLNGEPLAVETKKGGALPRGGRGRWEMGMEITRMGTNYQWTTWTVEDGRHVVNFRCIVDRDGVIVLGGMLNCFAFGWIEMDQGDADEILKEMEEDKPQWDVVQ